MWGATTRDECVATVRAAVLEHGINHLDMAPGYGPDREAERVVGLAFDGALPPGTRLTTKCPMGRRLLPSATTSSATRCPSRSL